jgi:hypothetical protein
MTPNTLNYFDEDDFIRKFNEKLNMEKRLRVQSVSSIVFILQIINLIYGTQCSFVEQKFTNSNGYKFRYIDIVLIENSIDGENIRFI